MSVPAGTLALMAAIGHQGVDEKLAALLEWLRVRDGEYEVVLSFGWPVIAMVVYRDQVVFTDSGPDYEARLDAVIAHLRVGAKVPA